jgi:hypothetical protein
MWEPECALKGGSIGIEREIILSGELLFAPLQQPLVTILLACRWSGEYVVWCVAFNGDWWSSL